MKGNENSIPLKNKIKTKCVALRRRYELVRVRGSVGISAFAMGPLDDSAGRLLGRVSGRYRYKYTVSMRMRRSEKPAAVAKGLAATVSTLAKAAPNAGPKVKAIEKQAPTRAMVAPRCFSSLMSAAIAVASWTLPSLKPPTTRLARNVRKSVAATHNATDAMLPAMDQRRAVLRPYLSDNDPMKGEAIAWSKENREPRAPPRRTIS